VAIPQWSNTIGGATDTCAYQLRSAIFSVMYEVYRCSCSWSEFRLQ